MHTSTEPAASRAAAASPAEPWLDDGRALYIQGLVALRDSDTDAAVELLTAALRRQPSHQGMRRNLMRALLAASRFRQALMQADVCLLAAPHDAELHFARGSALNGLGEPARASAALTRAAAFRPDHAATFLNLANAQADLDDLAAAEDLCRRAIELDPKLPEAHASLGYVLTAQGRVAAAIEACETAIRLSPTFTQAHWNLAIAALLAGDLPRGFTEYEWRKQHPSYRGDFPASAGPQWDGSDPAGRTILVRAEQGSGDVIQFARFLPAIHAAGGVPILVCSAPMAPLIRLIPGVHVVSSDDSPPPYDVWIDQMSLPRVFAATLDTLPGATGYLRADPHRVAAWRARLPGGLNVGVAFSGNPAHPNDRRRSIPRGLVAPLPDMPGITFINLHHGAAAVGLGLPDLSARLADYAETAALIEALDLVVSVDTSIAHLAGALGKPAWVLLAAAPDWRWLLGRPDSPWYASLRLLRQQQAGDWTGVLAQVIRELPTVSRSGPIV